MIGLHYYFLSLSIVGLFLGSCGVQLPFQQTESGELSTDTLNLENVQSGDLIFRAGNGVAGGFLESTDPETKYSHVGLVVIQQESPFVIHASLTGDSNGGKVMLDSLETFLARDQATAVAVYRPRDEETIESAIAIAKNYVEEEIPFDSGFDLSDSERLYCTELVWRAYQEAGLDLVEAEFDTISNPFLSHDEYILPSSLIKSNQLKYIYSISQ